MPIDPPNTIFGEHDDLETSRFMPIEQKKRSVDSAFSCIAWWSHSAHAAIPPKAKEKETLAADINHRC